MQCHSKLKIVVDSILPLSKNIFVSTVLKHVCNVTCLVNSSILISWMSPFPVLGVSGVLYNLNFIFDRN